MRRALLSFGLVFLATSMGNAFGGGFEKAIMTSAKYGAMGLTAAPIVNDAEALYLNPAGLGAIRGLTLTGNFSPTISEFKGPISSAYPAQESNTGFSPVFSAVAGMSPMEKLGIGIGAYVSGGTKAVFEDVPINPALPNFTPEVSSELTVLEFALGAGYELVDGLRIGAAWRIPVVMAHLATVVTTPPPAASVEVDDISKTKFNAFRAGIQYAPVGGSWGLGVDYRSQVTFNAEGDGTLVTSGGVTAASGKTTISNRFPQQISGGLYFDVVPRKWRLLGQYTWTEYSVNEVLTLSGAIPGALAQNWKNQSNYRLGTEYTLSDTVALRAGYIYTTNVTPQSNARATFSSPGVGHSAVIGAGTKMMDGMLTLNGALEYSFASGDVSAQEAALGTVPGEYSTDAFVAHIGLTYNL